jgi:hypothetical protein
MGRNVKPRISYENDALYLQRLATAVEMDETTSTDWRKEVIGHLTIVRSKFLAHASKHLRESVKTS